MSKKDKAKMTRPFMLLVAGIISFLFAEIISEQKHLEVDIGRRTRAFNEAFVGNYTIALNELSYLIDNFENHDNVSVTNLDLVDRFEEKYIKYGLTFLVSENQKPLFWSNNDITFSEILNNKEEGLIELQNGWFYFINKEIKDREFSALMLLKRNYNYQNKFLKNTYHKTYDMMPQSVSPSLTQTEHEAFGSKEQEAVFYFCPGEEKPVYYESKILHFAAVGFSIFALLLLFYSLYCIVFKWLFAERNSSIKAIGLFALLVVFARTLLYYVGIASPLANSEIFSPFLYATSYILPSLGDLFLNVLLVLWIAWVINIKINYSDIHPVANIWKKLFIVMPAILVIGLSGYGVYSLVRGLVINSRLNLNVNFVLSLDYYSVIGFLIICCLLFAFYFFSKAILSFIKAAVKPLKQLYIIVIALFVLIYLCTLFFDLGYPLVLAIFVLLFSLLIMNEKTDKEKQLRFSSLLVYVCVFSLISTAALYGFNKTKEQEERKTLALKLSSDQDPVAEFLFLENEQSLLYDESLIEIIYYDPYDEEGVYNYLKKNYFYDYWIKYDMQVTICHPEDMLLIKPANIEVECSLFFDDYIASYGKPTVSDYLYYLDNNTGRDSYIARMPIFFEQNNYDPGMLPDYYIYVEFDSKFIPRDLGFPELLVDESVDLNRELINYSFAFYKFGELTHRVGNYFFNNKSSAYGDFDDGFTFFETEDFHHLNYQKDEDTQIILGREKDGFFEIIAPFSYLFILFFIIVVVFWFVSHGRPDKINMEFNFKNRVQFSMVLIVILSGIIIGYASIWFLLNIHENKSLGIVSEKAYSVLIELEHHLGDEPYLDEAYSHYLSDQLLKLSNVFFTDINLFDPEGKLLAASRSRIYDEGLVSGFMNPMALSTMQEKNKSFYIHNECIGKLQYLSAYIPLKSFDNQLLAYINLPYFAREGELRYEMSTFLVTFMNIYLLLLVLAIIIAFFISSYVTRPLQLIKENLSRIKLGKTNLKINWTRGDEIGSLVNEYNRMIDELETSAELLAKNERESAWREMAKQVAHEIKNPLTPMKLSVQYLQKAWKDGVDDWEQRLDGFTKTMVEQIDTLSVIAGEFSDFAKLPSNNNSKINLKTFIPEVLELYKDFDKVKINFKADQEEMIVFADPKQMLRVFNNIIKNAIQSYEKDETAEIIIECFKEDNNAVISIRDKGCGIPGNQQKNIFKPYFTTKTGGLGLGLAMVKNIIEGFRGTITFESQAGIGSVFIIKLPLPKQQSHD